jgi:hypothetical protein
MQMSGAHDFWILALVLFTLCAVTGNPPHGTLKRPKEIIGYWIQGYAVIFLFLYIAGRFISPEDFVEGGRLEDRWLWMTTTAAWGGWAAGAYFGWWVRKLLRSRAPSPPDGSAG